MSAGRAPVKSLWQSAKKYLSFFRIRFSAGLQYRSAAWAGVLTQFAWGMLAILLFRAFHRSGSENFPMPFEQLSSYLWLQQAFLAMFMAWYFDEEIFEGILSGSIAYELCRPLNLYTMWFVKNMAVRLSRVLLRCLPILAVAALLPSPYGLSLPASPLHLLLTLVSMLLGFCLLISISMLVYITAFFTLSARGLRILLASTFEFFAGAIIPLPFFPDGVREVVMLLPFASVQSTPFLIYVGQHSGQDLLRVLGLQLLWLLVFWGSGRLLMAKALKRVVVQGG